MQLQSQSKTLMIQRYGNIHVVEFLELYLLDPVTIQRVDDELDELITRTAIPKLIVSLEDVRRMSLSLLSLLIAANKKVCAVGGQIRLASVSPSLAHLLKTRQFAKYLPIDENTSAALMRF